jgi:3-oxoacyl-[acyl-carrier protein] reductase
MKENVMSLHGNIALVTGASRGIGQAIACELGSRGAIVIGTATTDSGAEAITSNLTQLKIQGRGLRLNVAEAESAGEVIDIISTEYGAPTILVNNAGITRDNLLMRMKDEEWEAIISTNLSSVYRLSKAVLRSMMKARSGRIINITSVVGVTGNAGQTNYAAAKAGLIGFTKSLAREVGSRGITVNAVAPGFIDTDMTRSLADDQRNKLIQSIPLSRLGDVRDIAHAVAFLASAEASYITGETLHVNGGMHMS